jgi:hypothetical protein
MAFATWYFDVSAIELELRVTVMIEFFSLPAIWRVTAGAIGITRFVGSYLHRLRELPAVDILVAILTAQRKLGKLQGGFSISIFLMAGATTALAVASLQRQLGLGVVE